VAVGLEVLLGDASFSRATAAMRCIFAAWAISISDGIGRSLSWKPRFCVTPRGPALTEINKKVSGHYQGVSGPYQGVSKRALSHGGGLLRRAPWRRFNEPNLNGEGENHEKAQGDGGSGGSGERSSVPTRLARPGGRAKAWTTAWANCRRATPAPSSTCKGWVRGESMDSGLGELDKSYTGAEYMPGARGTGGRRGVKTWPTGAAAPAAN
jgi:hypothetical protein